MNKNFYRKKILFILNIDKFLLTHRIEIAEELLRNNYEVHLGAALTESSNKISKLGIKTHRISINRSGTNFLSLCKTILSIYKLIKIVKPDIIHLVSIKPVILGCIAYKFLKKKNQLVASISGMGFVFIDGGIIGYLRRIVTCNLYKFSLSDKNTKVIFQNESDRKFLTKICNLTENQTELIHGSGVNLKRFKPLQKYDSSNKVVLLPARIVKSKGILEFIEAANILAGKAKFIICGDFDHEAKDFISSNIIKYWVNKGIIEYIGFIKNMEEIISNASIVVLPSYREGLPKVLCEAAACGIPVITTDVPGCRDAIIEGKTGLLVPARNSIELANAIKKLLDDKIKLNKMSRAGRKIAENKFDINKVVARHLDIYKNNY